MGIYRRKDYLLFRIFKSVKTNIICLHIKGKKERNKGKKNKNESILERKNHRKKKSIFKVFLQRIAQSF